MLSFVGGLGCLPVARGSEMILARNVEQSTKEQVLAEYHYDRDSMGPAEIDHLISLELGGSNDIKNLWAQSYTSTPYNAHLKDALEDRLHSMVCKGQITLPVAQDAIRTDWIGAYKQYVETDGEH